MSLANIHGQRLSFASNLIEEEKESEAGKKIIIL